MTQPVRVGLLFPRSGQQVFIDVPPHVAERMNAQSGNYQFVTAEMPSNSVVPSGRHTGDSKRSTY